MSGVGHYGSGRGVDSEDLIKEVLQSAGWGVVETRKAADSGEAPVAESSDGDALRLPDFLVQHPKYSERYVEVKGKSKAVEFGIKQQDRHGWEKPKHEDYLEYRELSGRDVWYFVHEWETGVILRQRIEILPSGQTITDEDKLAAYRTDDPMILWPRSAFEPVVNDIGRYTSGFGQSGLIKEGADIDPFGLDGPGRQTTLLDGYEADDGDGENWVPEDGSRIAEIIRAHKSITVPELVREFVADREMTEEQGLEFIHRLEAEGLVYLVPHNAAPEKQVVKLP